MKPYLIRLVSIIILAFLVIYYVGLKPTLSLRKELKLKTSEYQHNAEDLKNLNLLEKENAFLDAILSESQGRFSDSDILKEVNRIADHNSLIIRSIEEPEVFKDSLGYTKKYKMELTGPYKNLMQWVYQFEKEPQLGKLKEIKILSDRSRKRILSVEFYSLQ